ncbi:MAG: hypothetical protein LBR83_01215 [Clostridiales bacterium]|jgi:predicted O-linked N-acetylglucosamine transferase (SPINDLY family)|nr:hypothetical protein [Clostridiales bacterium]
MDILTRKYYEKDDPKAIDYLLRGRQDLVIRDYQSAMRNFKKSFKSRISRPLTVLLLRQMANCMDVLEFYDQQQEFLEDLCEIELNMENVQDLMRIYIATNNEVKRAEFAKKIRKLSVENDDEKLQAITLLSQAKDYDEVIARSLEWLEKQPRDVNIAKNVINTYTEQGKIEEASEFVGKISELGLESELYLEIANVFQESFDFERSLEYKLKHTELHKENYFGVNRIAHTIMTDASYNGTLDFDDYVYWKERAIEGTMPQSPINMDFNINTNYFRKIRVGFVSYDFRAHSVGKFIMSLFDAISPNTGIETYCYYTYPDFEDDYTAVVKARADVFKYVGRYSDKQLRKELLGDDLDILVDLNGQTVGTKLGLLSERFAPMQVTWMGFPFSSFYYNIDYIIGDYFFDPVDGETERYCTEKVLRMDPCYMCFAMGTDFYISPDPPQTWNGYITFGMMNNPKKYSKEAIALWQKCLDATPGSRLLIQLSSNKGPFIENKFRERLEKYGLDMDRVDIGVDYGPTGYYRTYNKCDVMLDSFPFGGGTTTPESIWMGVPVIGCQYPMRHGRMAYSFMSNIGLGHLCADSVEAYPEKVREVSQNVALLKDLRQNLRETLKEKPLYNTMVFRDAFENAMRDAFLTYAFENKKPFDPEIYKGDDNKLLRDCIRSADIIMYEMTREQGGEGVPLTELFKEYKAIHALLLERFLNIYQDDIDALALAEKVAQILEMFNDSLDLTSIGVIVKSVKTLIVKFA